MWETICRGFGWKRRRDDDRFQRAEVTGSHLLAAWGRCSTQVEKKKVDFSRLFLPVRFLNGVLCFTVGFQCRTQLLSTFGRYWLHYDSTSKVLQPGFTVQAAHEYFQTDKYSSVVISDLQ